MELTEEQDEGHGGVFDLVLEELVRFQDASKSKESSRFGFDRVLRQLMAEREKAAVATALLKQHEETARVFSKQQNDFHQLRLQKQQEEFRAKLEEEMRLHNLKKDKLIARQDQERCSALEQQERQHMFFREVVQQLQDEVKVLRHSESGKSSVSRASYIGC